LLERAIRARGGPLASMARQVETEVYLAFPGTWRWRTVYMVPDRYAWTIFTAAEPDHYLFDGTTVRAFIGGREVSADTDPSAPLRSHARFTAVVNLDALRLPGVRAAPLSRAELPPGASAGLAVVLADYGSRYRLGFDGRGLLVWAEGPVRLPPLGQGQVVARFSDFRRVAGFLVPFRTSYTFGDERLADERALAVCPADPGVSLESFRAPRLVPDCGALLRPSHPLDAAPDGLREGREPLALDRRHLAPVGEHRGVLLELRHLPEGVGQARPRPLERGVVQASEQPLAFVAALRAGDRHARGLRPELCEPELTVLRAERPRRHRRQREQRGGCDRGDGPCCHRCPPACRSCRPGSRCCKGGAPFALVGNQERWSSRCQVANRLPSRSDQA